MTDDENALIRSGATLKDDAIEFVRAFLIASAQEHAQFVDNGEAYSNEYGAGETPMPACMS